MSNPPAFPNASLDNELSYGMALRDYFAAAALTGIVTGNTATDTIQGVVQMAQDAYSLAEAMLKQREAK